MGQNTDALIATCSGLALALEPLVNKIAGELKQLNDKKYQLTSKKAVPRQGEKLLRKSDAAKWLEELKEAKSARNVVAKDMGTLQNSALRNATKAAKDLESKIKKKDFLNFFKTQQSLDIAKKKLKQSQQAIDKTEEKLTAFNADYARYDDTFDKLTDLLKKALKEGLEEDGQQRILRPRANIVDPLVQEWTDKFERYLTKSNPNGLALLGNFQAVADKKAEVFKKLSSQIGKTKTWTEDTRKPMLKQIGDEISILSKINGDRLPGVIGKAQWDYWEKISKLPRTILSLPAIRQLIKKTEIADASVATLGETLIAKLEMLTVNFEILQKDLEAAGNDDNPESIKIALNDLKKAKVKLEESIDKISPETIEDSKGELSFLLDLAKKREPVTEKEWKKLQAIDLANSASGRIRTTDAIRNMDKGFLNAEGLALRFKKNTDIQNAYKDYKPVYKTSRKTAETYIKLQEEIYKRSSKLVEKTLSSK